MTTLRQLSDSTCKKLAPIYGDREARWLFRTIMEHIKGWNQVELALRADKKFRILLSNVLMTQPTDYLKVNLCSISMEILIGMA